MATIIIAAVIAVASIATTIYSECKKEDATKSLAAKQDAAEKKAIEGTKTDKKRLQMSNDVGTKKLADQTIAATALERLKAERSTRKASTLESEVAEIGGNSDSYKKTSAPAKAYFAGQPITTN